MKGRAWIPAAVLGGIALLGVTVLVLGEGGRDPREVESDSHASRESEGEGLELVEPERASPGRIAKETDAQREPAHVELGLLPAGQPVDEPVATISMRPLLEFRVLEAPGLPLADTPLEMRLRTGAHFLQRLVVRTESDGRFRLELPRGYALPDRSLWVFAREQTLCVRVDLGRAFPPGLTSMGDLLLAPTPVLIAGRVFENGRVVEGVAIEVERCTLARGKLLYWEKLGREIRSGAQGRFEVRDLVDSERLRVRARSESRLSRASVVQPGADTLELMLLETGTLAGSLRLAPGIQGAELKLRLVAEEIAEREWTTDAEWNHHGQVRGDGTFELEEQIPGRYSFSVWGKHGRLVEVAGIEILPGEAHRDARLQGLDLLDATAAEGR